MSAPFPPDCAEKFRPERLLASGGFGSVWLATQAGLERSVAVKLLHPDLLASPDERERFFAEARVTAALSHPNIVRVIDHGCAATAPEAPAGVPWIAYEYLPGRTLAEILSSSGPLAWPAALSVTMQVAAALDEAHARGVLHRDIKPSNILEAAPGLVKVTDFGIAKWPRSEAMRTAAGLILGTPYYIAPECVRGEPFNPRSDVYAVGVVLYEMLTGGVPFRHEYPHVVLHMQVSAPVPRPSARREDLPRELDGLVLKALEKDPSARFASAQELREAVLELRALLEGGEASGGLIPAGPVRRAREGADTGLAADRVNPGRAEPVRPDGPLALGSAAPRRTRKTRRAEALPAPSRVLPDAPMRSLLFAATFAMLVLLVLVRTFRPGAGVVSASTSPAPPSPAGSPRPALPAAQRAELAGKLAGLAAALRTAPNVELLMGALNSPTPDLSGAAQEAARMERVEEARLTAIAACAEPLERALAAGGAGPLPAGSEPAAADVRLLARARALRFASWRRLEYCRWHAKIFAGFSRNGQDTVLALMDLNLSLSKQSDYPDGVRFATGYLAVAASAFRTIPEALPADPTALDALLSDLLLVSRAAVGVRWSDASRGAVRAAADAFKRALANDPRPPVESISRAASSLWECGSANTTARQKTLLQSAAEDVRLLGTQIPAAAGALKPLADGLAQEAAGSK